MKQDFLKKMEQLFQKTAAVAGYIIAATFFLMVIGIFCKGFLMLKHFEKADIDINANPPPNILAERWGIRVYAISLLLKVGSVLVN